MLLDISNNDEYMWTNTFDISSSETPTTPQKPNYTSIIIGAVAGTLVGGALLSFGGLYLYRWNKSRQKQKQMLLIPGNERK